MSYMSLITFKSFVLGLQACRHETFDVVIDGEPPSLSKAIIYQYKEERRMTIITLLQVI